MQVAAGGSHFLALLEGGDVFAWGDNKYGQVGNGSRKYQDVPIRVLRGIKSIAAGWTHSLAVSTGGELFAWGSNHSGQLGDGTRTDRLEPTLVHANEKDVLFEVLSAAGGKEHTVAVVRDPTYMKCMCMVWGSNVSGLQACQTAASVTESTLTGLPQTALRPVPVLEDVCAVAAGMTHTLAINSKGDCMAWGRNGHGQLGDGSTVNRLSAVKVLEKVRSVGAGVDYSLAILESGECMAWGHNGSGRLGDGTAIDRLLPTKVLDGIYSISAGHYHGFAINKDAECYGWGHNLHGCICSAGNEEILRPVRVMTDAFLVAAGGTHTLAVARSGDMLVWGRNWHGLLSSLRAFGAAKAEAVFNPGPSREVLDALMDTMPMTVESGKALLQVGHPIGNPLALVDAAVDDFDDVGELPQPTPREVAAIGDSHDDDNNLTNSATSRKMSVAAASASGVDTSGEASSESSADLGEGAVEWSRGPTERHGKGVHMKLHKLAAQKGRAYMVTWVAFKNKALAVRESPDLSKAEMEDLLCEFHIHIVRRTHLFRAANALFGGASAHGWKSEDCMIGSGVEAVAAAFEKASEAVCGHADVFIVPPPDLGKASVADVCPRKSSK